MAAQEAGATTQAPAAPNYAPSPAGRNPVAGRNRAIRSEVSKRNTFAPSQEGAKKAFQKLGIPAREEKATLVTIVDHPGITASLGHKLGDVSVEYQLGIFYFGLPEGPRKRGGLDSQAAGGILPPSAGSLARETNAGGIRPVVPSRPTMPVKQEINYHQHDPTQQADSHGPARTFVVQCLPDGDDHRHQHPDCGDEEGQVPQEGHHPQDPKDSG